MFDYLEHHPNSGSYTLLERMEGSVPGYLSYTAEEGEVLCAFKSPAEAAQFYEEWHHQIPGEGWAPSVLERADLIEVLENFDLVSINPRPTPGSTEYLLTTADFERSLGEPG
ncbi:MAG: hypothetical protein H0V53_03660 [Rubrobacter sp.]|jgi:hypothetical protein|nr:hypothetical protein [Rubrobacter sp.]